MENSPNLLLPYIMSAQAQKHVTHNEALRALDALVQIGVLDRDLTMAPASPADGDRYIVSAGSTGTWAGHDGHIAAFQDGAWAFYPPRAGWLAWVADEAALLAFDGSSWSSSGAGGTSLNPTPLVGINATADTTNRLTVASPATLLNHDGASHQVKINKATTGDTAGLLYQTAFSGRAEMGLAGDDDFHVKVSADGTTWHEAIVVDGATGEVAFPNTSLGGGGGGAPGGATTQLQFNDAGSFAGDGALTWDKSNDALTVGQARLHTRADASAIGRNLFLGEGAGNFTLSPAGGSTALASHNTGLGRNSLASLTTGYDNTAIGAGAADGLTTAFQNVAIGYDALGAATTGQRNTAVGARALEASSTASNNTAIGALALRSVTTGSGNVAIGESALHLMTTGSGNVAFGALKAVTTGSNILGIGSNAGGSATTASGSVFIGVFAGFEVTTGQGNTLIGQHAGRGVTTGNGNTFLGGNWGATVAGITTGSWNVVIGAATGLAPTLS
ncbi:MAG: DUF2793 domain-containing protein, partial [Hyphomicrobiaceae bacterium]